MSIVTTGNDWIRLGSDQKSQIEKVLLNTSDMYSSIKGIAGNAVPVVGPLELPGADEDESDAWAISNRRRFTPRSPCTWFFAVPG